MLITSGHWKHGSILQKVNTADKFGIEIFLLQLLMKVLFKIWVLNTYNLVIDGIDSHSNNVSAFIALLQQLSASFNFGDITSGPLWPTVRVWPTISDEQW